MKKKRIFQISFVLLISLVFFISFVFAQGGDVLDTTSSREAVKEALKEQGDKYYNDFVKFVDETPVLNVLFGIFFGIWEPNLLLEKIFNKGTTKMGSIVIFFVTWLLVFFIAKDILDLMVLLSVRTTWLIALGITIVAAQLNLVILMSVWGVTLMTLVGVTSTWLLILIFFVLFILALFGSTLLSRWSTHLRIIKEAGKVEKGAAETEQAIRALKGVQRELKRGE